MTRKEFDQWFQDFSDRFPRKAEQFAKRGTLQAWCEVLADTELRPALEVNRMLHADMIEFPLNWDLIPSMVRDQAEIVALNWRLAATRTEPDLNQPRVCPHCQGTGVVLVYDNDQLKKWETRDQKPKAWARCGVACSCHRGDSHSVWVTRVKGKVVTQDLPRYDANQFCTFDLDDKHEQTIVAWLESRVPANRVAELDDWNYD